MTTWSTLLHPVWDAPRIGGSETLIACAQEALLGVVRHLAPPRRVVAVHGSMPSPVDLREAFPEAAVWRDTLAGARIWADWPDLLWLGFALSARDLDAPAALDAVAAALPVGGWVAAVDIAGCADASTRAMLGDDLGLDPDRDTHDLLRARFAPSAWLEVVHPERHSRIYAFLGTKARP